MKLTGILPALTTPFESGKPSVARLRDNLACYERLEPGGYLVLGSTGEAVLLDEPERGRVLVAARAAIPPRKPMVAGVPAESTRAAARQARAAAECGADAVLVATPHYFRAQMSAEALVHHLGKVADASPVPVLLYNVPKFTGLGIPVEVAARLSEHGNVAGMKESSGDLEYLKSVLEVVGAEFDVLCGEPSILRPALAAGAVGAILATATIFPEPLIRIASDGRAPTDLEREVARATVAVAGEHGVPGIKAAMDRRGLYGGPVRGPLRPLSEVASEAIGRVIAHLVERGVLPRERL